MKMEVGVVKANSKPQTKGVEAAREQASSRMTVWTDALHLSTRLSISFTA